MSEFTVGLCVHRDISCLSKQRPTFAGCEHLGPLILMLFCSSVSALTGVSNAEARQPGKSPSFSVNWIVSNTDLEVINATTGKRTCGGSSRLCKHTFYVRWAKLYGKVGLVNCWGYSLTVSHLTAGSLSTIDVTWR